MRNLADIKKIIIHCSESDFGDVTTIDRWHKDRGWSGVGYHYVITNGILRKQDTYVRAFDGIIQRGREWEKIGAHCKGQNRDSLGICLIGRHHFTALQLLTALPNLIVILGDLGIGAEDIFGHCEFNKTKTCPNIDPGLIRNMARLKWNRKTTLDPIKKENLAIPEDIKIGDTITPFTGLDLCRYFKLGYLVKRLDGNLDKYKSFVFDGASCLPDALTACLTGINKECLTYKAALRHDLCYAYGEVGNDIEKERVDLKFKSDLITKCNMDLWLAEIFHKAVRIGGEEYLGLSFSWAFGKRE